MHFVVGWNPPIDQGLLNHPLVDLDLHSFEFVPLPQLLDFLMQFLPLILI